MMMDQNSIQSALNLIDKRIATAAQAAGRTRDDVKLMAVSKKKPAADIEQAILAGQTLFGENRVQEAQDKWPDLLQKYPDIKLHLIGPLQTNKVRQAVKLFHAIHSLDRPKLAHSLARVMEEEGISIPVYIQVNTGDEPQKAGVGLDDLPSFVSLARDELGLNVQGLMAIPPAHDHPGPHFALLARLARDLGLSELSMGMSGDYEQAIQLGSTLVRVGSSIFGARD